MDLDFTKIPQNSRTIIFERFNDQASSLLLIKGMKPDEALEKVNETLCVRSFAEFKERFKPTVYEMSNVDEQGNWAVHYSLEKRENGVPANAIELCKHEFYRAVHDIALEKSASDKNNEMIDYSKLYEALDPKRIYTRARRRREEVRQYVQNAYEAAEKGDPDNKKRWMKLATQTLADVKEEYSGNALRLLPLAIRDTELILEGRGITSEQAVMIESDSSAPAALPCTIKWNSDGEIIAEPIDSQQPEVLGLEQKEDKVLQLTHKGWENTADQLGNSVDRDTFLSVYSAQKNAALAEKPTKELVKRKKAFGDIYVAAQESFCNAVAHLVQKVASMEQFFIHAGDENGIVESGVIIANCSISDVLENKEEIRTFLKAANNCEADRIWFAVLPAVMDKNGNWNENSSVSNDDDDPPEFNFSSDEENNKKDVVKKTTASDVNNINDLLAEYGILSFVNPNACKETSFKSFGTDTEMLEKYNQEFSCINKTDSLVLAFPNFTIIPSNKRHVEVIDEKTLYTPTIYIDAAYVAAGIVAATQTSKIQKKKFGKRVIDGRPFIRFDLEEEESSEAFHAKFNPESRLNMDRNVASYLRGKDGKGFCFRSDSLSKNAFVFTARKLDGKPVYQFITQQYLSFLLQRTFAMGGLNSEKAKGFERAVYNIKGNETDKSVVNQLLRTEESLLYNDDTRSFTLQFKGVDEPVDVVVDIID